MEQNVNEIAHHIWDLASKSHIESNENVASLYDILIANREYFKDLYDIRKNEGKLKINRELTSAYKKKFGGNLRFCLFDSIALKDRETITLGCWDDSNNACYHSILARNNQSNEVSIQYYYPDNVEKIYKNVLDVYGNEINKIFDIERKFYQPVENFKPSVSVYYDLFEFILKSGDDNYNILFFPNDSLCNCRAFFTAIEENFTSSGIPDIIYESILESVPVEVATLPIETQIAYSAYYKKEKEDKLILERKK